MLHKKYDYEEGPVPQYEISRDLSYLTIAFIVSSVTYFLVAGSLAIIMRTIQSQGIVFVNISQTTGLFYTSLTIHGQLMFFGFASMLTIGISYFLISKFARKPLYSMKIAYASFSLMNAGAIFLIISGTMFFGGGWYNLMPLAFHPGNNGWNTLSAVIFLMADVIIGIALVIFCVNILATVLKGKIAAGLQKSEQLDDDIHKYKSDEDDGGRVDLLPLVHMPPSIRWISILGISSWFPIKYRSQIPAVSIVVVGVFINALVMLAGTPGLFSQLAIGFSYLVDPNFDPNWLLAKDAWWFFGHPIVYFTLFSFLAAAYYYIPRYTKKTVPYDKWAYRSWPFYFIFTMLVFTHHTYLDMPNPDWVKMVSQAASFGIIFPSALTIMTILMYIFRSRINWNVTSMFIMTGIVGWAYGGFTGTETGWWGTNIYLHNTLNVVGHIHFVLLMGSVLLGLGLIYSIVPAITGKNLNNNLGMIHLVLTGIGGFGLAFLFTNLGFEGFVRREAIAPDQFAWSMPWLIFFAFTVGLGQIIFAYNLFRTLKYGQWFKSNGLYYAAAISTSLAGILHLVLVQYFVGFDSLTSTFFIVAGLAQIFWLVPFLRKWGNIWYTIGIAGTIVLIVLFVNSQASGETGLDWKFVLFYLIIGGAQLLWIIPLVLRWSKARFYGGISGTILVSLFWLITNSPESVVGVEAPYDDLSIFIEGLQVVFIVTSVMVILRGGNLWPEKNIDSNRGSDHGSSNVGATSTPELDIRFREFKP